MTMLPLFVWHIYIILLLLSGPSIVDAFSSSSIGFQSPRMMRVVRSNHYKIRQSATIGVANSNNHENHNDSNDSKRSLFVGFDLGTSGARVSVLTKQRKQKTPKVEDNSGETTTATDHDSWVEVFSESVAWGGDSNLGNYDNPHCSEKWKLQQQRNQTYFQWNQSDRFAFLEHRLVAY